MKIKIIFFSIAILLTAIMCYSHFKLQSEDYEKIANAITKKTAKKLNDEYSLILVGIGGGMMDNIKMMMMGFQFRKPVSLEMARKLLIDSIQEYLSEINSSEKIRPYLHNYPFTAQNIQIKIFFCNPDGSEVAPDQINVASAVEGKMFYYIDYSEKHTLKEIHKETYEEAVHAKDSNYVDEYPTRHSRSSSMETDRH